MAQDFISELVTDFKRGWQEGKAEYVRRTTPIAYWCDLHDDFSYTPHGFYALVEQHLVKRAVPDLVTGYTLMREGTVFSRKRLYLELRRERFVFQICCAAFGTGWFISSRLFDRRRGAKWWDFLILVVFLWWLNTALWFLFGTLVAVAVLGLIITFTWSLMRLAASESAARLDDLLCRLPFVGRVYETLFHPDTYFRQDQRNMYRKAVDRAVEDALRDLEATRGLKRTTVAERAPALAELQER